MSRRKSAGALIALVGAVTGAGPVAAQAVLSHDDAVSARAKALPDLVVSALTVTPNPATPGATLTVGDTVRNRGRSAAGATREQYWLSATRKLKSSKRKKRRNDRKGTAISTPLALGQRTVARLASKKSAPGVTKIALPSSVAPGAYFVIACANGVRPVREGKVTNNCRAAALRIVPRSDVNGISLSSPSPGPGAAGTGGPGTAGGPATGGGPGTGGGNPPPPGPSTLKLTPGQSSDRPVRTGHTVTATLKDADGKPRAHEQVAFKVTGANANSAVKNTGDDGTVAFTYVGLNAGKDTIVASSTDLQSDPASVTWTHAPADAPSPTVSGLSIADGSLVTSPTSVSAVVTPPSGATIASWTVTLRRMGGDPLQVIAHGDGPPGAVLGTLDPTLRPNGTYRLSVIAVTDAGASGLQSANITLGGELKLGRFANTYRDIAIPVIGSTMALDRHYDSTDKSPGDFGIGWRLEFSGARAAANAVLGLGGWSEQQAGCSLFGCTYNLKNTNARFVTVTQPDGTTEIYDMTSQVAGGGLILGDHSGTAKFTARANTGTTGKLEVDGDASIYYQPGSDTVLGPDDATPFDPTRFKLTQHDGRVLIIDTTEGVISETDLNGNAITIDDAGVHATNGQSITLQRDPAGRITRATAPSGAHLDYHYNASGDLDQVTDELGHPTKYTYDLNHNVLTSTGPGTPFQRIDYDDTGRMTAITDATGNVTHVTDDPTNRVTTTTDPLGKLTTINHYNARGDVVKLEKSFSGKTLTTTATYDSAGNRLSETDPLGHTRSWTYNSAGDPTSDTDSAGRTWTVTYDSHGLPTQVTAPGGAVQETVTRDAQGNPTALTRAGGGVQHCTYDSSGKVLTWLDGSGSQHNFTYDTAGRLATVTNAPSGVASLTHDAIGRVTSVTSLAGETVTYSYDAGGHQTGLTDANGSHWSYGYDAAGNQTSTTDPLGHTSTKQYDAAGRVVSATDREGHTITSTYDADGQLVKNSSAVDDITDSYDPLGRLTDASNSAQHVTYAYDDAGRRTSIATSPLGGAQVPGAVVSVHFDPSGLATSVDGPGGSIAYSYNAAGLLAGVDDAHADHFSLGYTAGQLQNSLTRPNAVADTWTYDGNDRVLTLTSTHGADPVAATQFTYNAAGRRASETTAVGTTTLTYDGAGRLIGADHPAAGPPDEAYTYDPAGNRLSSATDAPGSMVYDSADRLLADSRYDYTYDLDGRLTSKTAKVGGAKTTFDWNARGQLTTVHRPGGATTTYLYDPEGRRIEKNGGIGHITRTVWGDGDNPLAMYDGSGNRTDLTYLPVIDGLLEVDAGGQRTYPVQDPRRSIVASTLPAGTVGSSYSYDSFGVPQGSAATSNLLAGFAGRPWDATLGLYDFRARDLDPTTGRFVSEDPLPATNPFPYVLNDPISLSDQTGMSILEKVVVENKGLSRYTFFNPHRAYQLYLLARLIKALAGAPMQNEFKSPFLAPTIRFIQTIGGR